VLLGNPISNLRFGSLTRLAKYRIKIRYFAYFSKKFFEPEVSEKLESMGGGTMINLEQVRLLETRVAKAVDFIERLTKENAALGQQVMGLRDKLAATQKRIDELENLVTGFKEDQNQIEESILAALDRLSQFEKAMEKSLKEKPAAKNPSKASRSAPGETVPEQTAAEETAGESGSGQTCFEIPDDSADDDDIPDPLGDTANDTAATEGGELDIF
jgi:TolA-binding protein